jgi:hypothetical protein
LTSKTPTDVYYLSTEGAISDAKITSMITNSPASISDSTLLFDLVKCYINGNLTVTTDLLKEINSHYYEASIRTYILLPMVIYALKSV